MESAPVVSVTGWSGTGKTTLITRLIRELKLRNLPAAALKQIHEDAFREKPGSDSDLYVKAGAVQAGLATPGGAVFMLPEFKWTKAALQAVFTGARLIICEGLRIPGVPVIQTAGGLTRPEDLKGNAGEWELVLTDDPGLQDRLARMNVKTLPQSDIEPLCEYLISLIPTAV